MRHKLSVAVALLLATAIPPVFPFTSQAQAGCQLFPQTGKSACGKFLAYWQTHGGLAQQGYPISNELRETSDTDGRTYTVQYFERAVFELHPENASPNDVLLSLLGSFLYKQKYPGGAPGQKTNASPDTMIFKETGHSAGGKFLAYWQAHGDLAQQGYPISDEFTEVSDLDGKPYLVQYFERAVFELHPEYAGTASEVLLAQLGTFRYKQKYLQPKPSATPTAVSVQPTPTSKPVFPNSDCSGIPASPHMTVTPNCSPRNRNHTFEASGLRPGEYIDVWLTDPLQRTFTLKLSDSVDGEGKARWGLRTDWAWLPGIWALSMHGYRSGIDAVGYFKLIIEGVGMDCSGVPPSVNMTVVPDCAPAGVYFEFEGSGFQPGEKVGRYYTSPQGEVFPGSGQSIADEQGMVKDITKFTTTGDPLGIWSGTFEGTESHHRAIGYFKLTQPVPWP
jgi:hypothetical protein